MHQSPLVSIIIAAYNAESYIAAAVTSCCRQSYTNLEILVVDDGSVDATAAIVRAMARDDSRIRLLALPKNAGVSTARNLALHQAKGEWIAILDADDRFHPDRIARMLDFATSHGLDLAADNLDMIDFSTGKPAGLGFPEDWMDETQDATLRYILERDLPGRFRREIGFMKPLMRRAFLDRYNLRYDPDIWAGEDFLFYIDCLLHGARLRFINAALYVYFLRPGSASSGQNANCELAKVNDRLIHSIGPMDPKLMSLLQLRRVLLNYEIFRWHLRSQRVLLAMLLTIKIPKKFLLKRLSLAALRRLWPRRCGILEAL